MSFERTTKRLSLSRPRAAFNNRTAIYIKLAVCARGCTKPPQWWRPPLCGKRGLFITAFFKYRDLKTEGSLARRKGPLSAGLGCAQQCASARAPTTTARRAWYYYNKWLRVACLLQKNCWTARAASCDGPSSPSSRSFRWVYNSRYDKASGVARARRVRECADTELSARMRRTRGMCATKSGGGYFYAKLLTWRVNICMAIRASVSPPRRRASARDSFFCFFFSFTKPDLMGVKIVIKLFGSFNSSYLFPRIVQITCCCAAVYKDNCEEIRNAYISFFTCAHN